MTPLIYSLHSGNLYGTERMALATAAGLRDEFDTIFFAPQGPFHAEAARLGFRSLEFETTSRYFADLRPFFARNTQIAALGTRVLHTIAADFWSRLYFRKCANIQVVHGGADERLSYGRKRWLDLLGAKQVAVSQFVRQRMESHGADPARITVIENFLTPETIAATPRRGPYLAPGIRRVAIVSRLDPVKRLDLLLDTLDLDPSLRTMEFAVYGSGPDAELLKTRALASHPNVQFMGFRPDVANLVSQADLLLHLCPEEPFGLAILEAMAAGVVVLVPDSGGAGAIVDEGHTGFHFAANDAADLARILHVLDRSPAALLESAAEEAGLALRSRYSATAGVLAYRNLIHRCLR